jgi:exopolysaccharide biosynthesis polyprenyl glycosylphosphotransferase
MLRRFSINFAIFSMFLDGAVLLASLAFTAYIRPSMSSLPGVAEITQAIHLPVILLLIFPILWVGILAAFSIYDGRKNIRVVDEFAALTAGAFIASISMAGILYFSFRDVSRALFLSAIVVAYLICLIWRMIARLVFRMRNRFAEPAKKLMLIGKNFFGAHLAEQLTSKTKGGSTAQINGIPSTRHDFVGYFDLEKRSLSGGSGWVKKKLAVEELPGIIEDLGVTEVIVALPHTEQGELDQIVLLLEKSPIKLWVALDFMDLALHNAIVDDFTGIPMVDLRAPAISDYDLIIKRIFDLILASIFTILLLPVMVVIGILILVFDGWPVFFSQERVGENGKLFRMHKFRTMVVNADRMASVVAQKDENGNAIHKTRHDPRVTRPGSFLRRFSLDELPQFFNVLSGEMSLVGPRPELPRLVNEYQHWQRQRMAVPPGMTGWWQVNGRSERMMHLHVEDDLYYVNHYSIWLDLWIMLKTGWVILSGRGAY